MLARVAPFLIFVVLTACQGQFGESSRYWFYVAKTLVGAWLLCALWASIEELKWAWSWEAVVVGIVVFLLWVGLDGLYPTLSELAQNYLCPVLRKLGLDSWCPEPSDPHKPWNPHAQFGADSALAWLIIVVRIVGSTLVVPPLEELFYRSLLYRYVIRADFQSVPLGTFRWIAFLSTSAVFGLSHREWLAGILCGFAYQGLVCRKNRLGDALSAHAITNLLLGLWVVWKGAWQFW